MVRIFDGVACSTFAARLHGFPVPDLKEPFVAVPPGRHSLHPTLCTRSISEQDLTQVNGVLCTTPLRTLVDIASESSAIAWEQALEFVLHSRLTTVYELEERLPSLRKGAPLIRSVLETRGNVPPAESVLETMAVQLFRTDPRIPRPVRQFEVITPSGRTLARQDFAFPSHELFVELDGRHHTHQVIHDIARQNRVVAHTGWRVARFTWHDITNKPNATLRTLRALLSIPAP